MAQNATKRGKYERVTHKKRRNRNRSVKVTLICCVVLLVGLLGLCWILETNQTENSVFARITDDGYSGTQEQWLASIAGEEAGEGNVQSSYQMACDNGYRESEESWILTLTGYEDYSQGESPYDIACRNGYSGTLAQWMQSIAGEPDSLGVSKDGESKTEYELACEYGYTGTFIEWIISVTSDRAF